MTISIFTTDEQLLVKSWDSQLESMRGLDAESVYGCPLTEIIPDLESRGLLARFNQVLEDGTIETLAPDFHHYLIKCPPRKPSKYFDSMQQRVTIAPLREKTAIVGLVITLEDVTERMDAEWELASDRTLSNSEPEEIDSDTSVHESLIAALADDRWQVRQNATRHLTNVKAPELNAQLLQLLRQQHHNPNILNSVIQVLTLTQVDIVPALIDCLKEEDSDLRIYVVQTLGQRKDPRAVSVLIEMLDDENVNVRYHAIEALGKLQALEAVDSLVKIAESEDFFLAFPALDALMQMVNAKLAPQLVPLLQKTLNWQLRREAVDNLAITDDPEIIRSLLRLMREQHRNPNVLNATLQILALSNVDPIPALVECLGEPDPDLRIYTALALGERHDPRAIPPLIGLLNDPDINVRYHAIESLGQLKAKEAVEPLVEIATSGDFFLAFPAIETLVTIGDTTIIPKLLPLLENELLCSPVVSALGKFADADAVAPLVAQLSRPLTSIAEIVLALAEIYANYKQLEEGQHIAVLTRQVIEDQAVENILAEIEQGSLSGPELRGMVMILGWLEGEKIEQTLGKLLNNHEVRDPVMEALVAYGGRIAPLLIMQLEAGDLETRKAAVMALGRIGSTQAVPALMSLLGNAEPELVMVTTTALAHISDGRAFEGLLQLLAHPDSAVRLGAIAALNSLGHPAMPPRIYDLLADPNPLVRESAVRIAGYFAFENCKDRLLACTQDSEDRVCRAAIEHLPYLEDDRVLPLLVQTLAHPSASLRSAVAHAMGELENIETLPYLLQGLDDPESWVRYQAARSIGRYADTLIDILESGSSSSLPEPLAELNVAEWAESAFVALKQLANYDPADPVRAIAAESLGAIAGVRATPILSRLAELEDEGGDVARAALRALGRINRAQAIPPLLTALNSPNSERRLDALHAFRERGGTEAGVALQWMAAADPEERLVYEAIESLSRLATPEAISALLELTVDPSTREACLNALVRRNCPETLEAEYIELVAQGLKHIHPGVRCSVVEVLKRFKHPIASEFLIQALSDADQNVRLAAVTALVYLGNHSGDEQLAKLARTDPSPAIRRAAHRGLHSS